VRDIFVAYRRIGEIGEIVFEARFGWTPEIEYDLDDFLNVIESDERLAYREWEDVKELGELPACRNRMDSGGH
jgi:hypothetical protein